MEIYDRASSIVQADDEYARLVYWVAIQHDNAVDGPKWFAGRWYSPIEIIDVIPPGSLGGYWGCLSRPIRLALHSAPGFELFGVARQRLWNRIEGIPTNIETAGQQPLKPSEPPPPPTPPVVEPPSRSVLAVWLREQIDALGLDSCYGPIRKAIGLQQDAIDRVLNDRPHKRKTAARLFRRW